MSRIRKTLVVFTAFAIAMLGFQFFTASPAAADADVQARTVYYTAYAYSSQSAQAAQIWNSRVPNLNMVSRSNGTIRIYATTGGGSRAYPCGLGCATIYIDSRDIAAGHNTLRIISHEIGHGHRLPDTYNGICSYLMSGGSAGTSCTNPYPNSGEASRVNSYYAGFALKGPAPVSGGVYAPTYPSTS
ncbi:snapalysin family zinc-dependent metalloprotease [Stackebrandtia nassauensis]|nr:snapalysin family zinc-dependent metalloprotease [Stackebrandtia nassauensis]